jgi:hypothetical protein
MTREKDQSIRRAALILGVCLAWTLISLPPIWKYLPHTKALIVTALGILSIAVGMYCLDRLNRRTRQISIGWFLLLFVTLTAAFAVLYPLSLRHTINIGSDREDALRKELTAVCNHQYPYDVRTFLGNAPTPLPGAMLLAAPFFAVGHIAWQNILWLALFFYFAIRFFRFRATALCYLAVLLLFAPGNLNDFTSGGDYLTNFFYVAIAVAIFAQSLDHPLGPRPYAFIPAAIFLGIALSSRVIYVVILIPLLALALERHSRARVAAAFAIVLTAAAAITLPVFAPAPFGRLLQQLNQSSLKLRYIPHWLHPQWSLPALAILTGCIAFFIRMNLPRLFLIFSASCFVMLAPFVATFSLHSDKLRYAFFYLSVSSLSFTLWAFWQYERMSATIPDPINSIKSTEATLSSRIKQDRPAVEHPSF